MIVIIASFCPKMEINVLFRAFFAHFFDIITYFLYFCGNVSYEELTFSRRRYGFAMQISSNSLIEQAPQKKKKEDARPKIY